jgi:hypothetical protein
VKNKKDGTVAVSILLAGEFLAGNFQMNIISRFYFIGHLLLCNMMPGKIEEKKSF